MGTETTILPLQRFTKKPETFLASYIVEGTRFEAHCGQDNWLPSMQKVVEAVRLAPDFAPLRRVVYGDYSVTAVTEGDITCAVVMIIGDPEAKSVLRMLRRAVADYRRLHVKLETPAFSSVLPAETLVSAVV